MTPRRIAALAASLALGLACAPRLAPELDGAWVFEGTDGLAGVLFLQDAQGTLDLDVAGTQRTWQARSTWRGLVPCLELEAAPEAPLALPGDYADGWWIGTVPDTVSASPWTPGLAWAAWRWIR